MQRQQTRQASTANSTTMFCWASNTPCSRYSSSAHFLESSMGGNSGKGSRYETFCTSCSTCAAGQCHCRRCHPAKPHNMQSLYNGSQWTKASLLCSLLLGQLHCLGLQSCWREIPSSFLQYTEQIRPCVQLSKKTR